MTTNQDLRNLFEMYIANPRTDKDALYKFLTLRNYDIDENNVVIKVSKRHFHKGYITATEVQEKLRDEENVNLDVTAIGNIMKKYYKQVSKRINGDPKKVYVPFAG